MIICNASVVIEQTSKNRRRFARERRRIREHVRAWYQRNVNNARDLRV